MAGGRLENVNDVYSEMNNGGCGFAEMVVGLLGGVTTSGCSTGWCIVLFEH